LYIKVEQDERIYVLIFVDDLIITGSSEDKVNKLKIDLSNAFNMKDLGKISYYLGISVHQDIENGVVT
jgi:histone deacetylase 1/2